MKVCGFRTLSLLLVLFSVLLLVSVKEVAAQKKERVGRHSPAYMRSVLYLYNNIGHNIDIIFYLGKSEEQQALFGGFNIGQDHRAFDMGLFDYRGLVKRRPKTNHYAKIQKAIGLRSIIVIAIEGVDVSHYKAIIPALYPYEVSEFKSVISY